MEVNEEQTEESNDIAKWRNSIISDSKIAIIAIIAKQHPREDVNSKIAIIAKQYPCEDVNCKIAIIAK